MPEETSTTMSLPFGTKDPGACTHDRVERIGIQSLPMGRLRLYLVTCRDCGTTLTTRTLRDMREGKRPRPPAS